MRECLLDSNTIVPPRAALCKCLLFDDSGAAQKLEPRNARDPASRLLLWENSCLESSLTKADLGVWGALAGEIAQFFIFLFFSETP